MLEARTEVQLEFETTTVRGFEVPFRSAGRGEPVILLHGLAGSFRWWKPALPLGRRYRLHMPDLPGFGGMRPLGRDFTLERAAAWLLDWMDAVDLDRAHIVAHSMGANIALRLALAHPSRVGRLALIAPAGIAPTRPLLEHLGVFVRAARMASPRFLGVLARDSMRAGPRLIVDASRELRTQDLRADLQRIASPTLVICAEGDPLVPIATARQVADTVPDAQLLVLGAAGHVPMFEEPAVVNRALDAFLAGELLSPALLAAGSEEDRSWIESRAGITGALARLRA